MFKLVRTFRLTLLSVRLPVCGLGASIGTNGFSNPFRLDGSCSQLLDLCLLWPVGCKANSVGETFPWSMDDCLVGPRLGHGFEPILFVWLGARPNELPFPVFIFGNHNQGAVRVFVTFVPGVKSFVDLVQ
jgi:hypothetical protein